MKFSFLEENVNKMLKEIFILTNILLTFMINLITNKSG